jgi:hypothetical protein
LRPDFGQKHGDQTDGVVQNKMLLRAKLVESRVTFFIGK